MKFKVFSKKINHFSSIRLKAGESVLEHLTVFSNHKVKKR